MQCNVEIAFKASEMSRSNLRGKVVNNRTVCYTGEELDLSERSGFGTPPIFFPATRQEGQNWHETCLVVRVDRFALE
jgi:hypothetical protein